MPANCGLFVGDRETSVRIGLRGGGHSRSRTRLSIRSTDGVFFLYKKGGLAGRFLSIQSIFPSIKRGVGGTLRIQPGILKKMPLPAIFILKSTSVFNCLQRKFPTQLNREFSECIQSTFPSIKGGLAGRFAIL